MSGKNAEQKKKTIYGRFRKKLRKYLKALGPGLVTGASDDDPSGIATYSQTGAQFGYAQLWTALFTFPLMSGIQEICARIALHTGKGVADLIRANYSKRVLLFCVSLLFVANAVNLGADLGAMAAAAQMIAGIHYFAWLTGITLLSIILQVFISYRIYSKYLRLLTLSLTAYALAFFASPHDWGKILKSTFVPMISANRDYLMNLVALLGTTISPYMFFWQAGQEIEEEIEQGEKTLKSRKGVSGKELRWMRTDVLSGMFISNLIMWFIIGTTASFFSQGGTMQIDTAQKAAEALKPIAGEFAYIVFAAGIIGTGLLAVPVLAGSAAYAVSEAFKMREGLYLKMRQAPGFYGVIVISMIIGFSIDLLEINPIKALYYSAVLNGIVAPPLLLIIMLMSNNSKIMHDRVNTPVSNIFGWLTAAVMTVSAGALLLSLALGEK